MAKITIVPKSAKDQGTCGRCGDPLPKGCAYRHATPGFRGRKIKRCMKPECGFRQSELTTSKMAEVYAAQEDAEDNLNPATCLEDIRQALDECADRCEEVANEYREAAEAMGGAGTEMEDKADEIESWCDELRSFDEEEFSTEVTVFDESTQIEVDDEPEIDLEAAIEQAKVVVGSLSL